MDRYKIVITDIPCDKYDQFAALLISEGYASSLSVPEIKRNANYNEKEYLGVMVSIDERGMLGFCWNDKSGFNYYEGQHVKEWLSYDDLIKECDSE